MGKIKVFEAFAGYGSQAMALKRAGIAHEVVGISEIDKYAIQGYNAVHGETKNYGDISKIDWNDVEDFDFLSYSFPCFTEGTLIHTDNGIKCIESITTNDKVLTHTNAYKKVTMPMKKKYSGDIYNISAMCFHKLECTPEHPFYVREKSYKWEYKGALSKEGRKKNSKVRYFTEPKWVDAKDLTKNHYLGYAINQISELPRWGGVINNMRGHNRNENKLSPLFENKHFWYVMGRYIADGWEKTSKDGNGIVICCGGRNESQLINAIHQIGYKPTVVKEKTAAKYTLSSKELHSFVERYGYYAWGKEIDIETLNLPIALLKSFIDGYTDGDGYFDKKNNSYKISTVSKKLAYGIQQCISKVYQCPVKLYRTKRPATTIIEGRKVNQRDVYEIVYKSDKRIQDHAFYEDGYVWFPIRSIEVCQKECEVYNMSVEEDESYTANGCIVHNCTDISNAGKQKGFAKGSGTRSSLLWECERAIELKRPKYLMMENVKALVFKKNIEGFKEWIKVLEDLGYKNYWKVLNAKDFGVPQNRERVFMISILGDGEFEFPNTKPLDRCISDILEDDVDDKFYVSNEQLKSIANSSFVQRREILQEKLYCDTILARVYKEPKIVQVGNLREKTEGFTNPQTGRVYSPEGISPTINTMQGGDRQPKVVIGAFRGRYPENTSDRSAGCPTEQRLEINKQGISDTITTVQKDNIVLQIPQATKQGYIEVSDGGVYDSSYPNSSTRRGRVQDGGSISPTLMTGNASQINLFKDACIRKLTPKECLRLMDVSDDDITKMQESGLSNTQLYKQAGNSIVVGVMVEIFKNLFKTK